MRCFDTALLLHVIARRHDLHTTQVVGLVSTYPIDTCRQYNNKMEKPRSVIVVGEYFCDRWRLASFAVQHHADDQ